MSRILLTLLVLTACESESKPSLPVESSPEVVPERDDSNLIKRVEKARDREVSAEQDVTLELPASVAEEFRTLDLAFYGETRDRSFVLPWAKPSNDIERFLSYAMSSDRHAKWVPQSVDAWFAYTAVRHSAPLLALYFDRARAVADVSPTRVASRPDLGAKLKDVAPLLSTFAGREGFVFANALYRSNGWSGVEYALAEPPSSSAFISRPDRWLAGESLGKWNMPESAPDGEVPQSAGMVGPAYLEELLDQVLAPGQAASVHQSWLSDHYRYYKHGDEWAFEFVSLWRSESDAEQMVEAFDLALRVRRRKAVFAVTRTGNRVAIGMASNGNTSEALDIAVGVVRSVVSFDDGDPKLIKFVSTDYDQLIENQSKISVSDDGIVEPLTGFRFPPLDPEWEIKVHKSGTLRWSAMSGDTAMQFSVELSNPFGPKFSDPSFGKNWKSQFEATMQNVVVQKLEQVSVATRNAWKIHLIGDRQGARNTIHAVLIDVGRYWAVLSLVDAGTPDVTRFERYIESVEIPGAPARLPSSMTFTAE